jgi:hypothetical protein
LTKALESSVAQIVISVVDLLHAVVRGCAGTATNHPPLLSSIFTQVLERALVLASNMVDEQVRLKVGALLLDLVRAHILSRFSLDDVLYPFFDYSLVSLPPHHAPRTTHTIHTHARTHTRTHAHTHTHTKPVAS